MLVVTLIPLTKRAKQIVKQHGERWEVLRKEDRVLFSDKAGPWWLIQPLSEERALPKTVAEAKTESASRWVHAYFDDNFKVAP